MLSKNKHKFGGIYVATICPMHKDGSINEEGLTDHFNNLINYEGIVGFLINGHAGENHLLNRDEKRRIVEIAKKRKIFILEDAAQSLGSKINGKKTGSIGNASIISFGHAKILDCGGGGGILTND